ncbi:hypothetical protein F4802DRAFT_596261 [Xylaria palmicola]|nr:hypothetical protein F4802DRAFT_596261 [Xylaria palmicola]
MNLDDILDQPALPPPPGEEPDFSHPPSHHTAFVISVTVAFTVSTLAVLMRLYTRARAIHKVSIADYSLLLAWGVFVGYVALSIVSDIYEPGVHQWDITLRNLIHWRYYFHISSTIYGICIFFIKLSILMQYIEIFMPNREPLIMFWATIVLIVANFLFYSTSVFLEIFSCQPIDKAWNLLIKEGHCIDLIKLNIAASTFNVISDITILLLPQPMIWKLKLPFRNRLTVSTIFLVAIIACISAGIRLYYALVLPHEKDFTWNSWYVSTWTLAEMASGFLVASLPVTRKFAHHVGHSAIFSSISSSVMRLVHSAATDSGRSTTGHAFNTGSRTSFANQINERPSAEPPPPPYTKTDPTREEHLAQQTHEKRKLARQLEQQNKDYEAMLADVSQEARKAVRRSAEAKKRARRMEQEQQENAAMIEELPREKERYERSYDTFKSKSGNVRNGAVNGLAAGVTSGVIAAGAAAVCLVM